MSTSKRSFGIPMLAAGLVLGLALAAQLRPSLQKVEFPREVALDKFLPTEFPGWQVKDEPVASSEEVKRAVEWGLNYDEGILRNYTKGNEIISVYMAFWQPGKFPPRLIAQHVPDLCWTGIGWKMENLDRIALPAQTGGVLPAAQYRKFTQQGVTLYVAYWHLVGGQLSGFTEGVNKVSHSIWDNWRAEMTHGHAEQYFIRIASSRPIAGMLDTTTPLPAVMQKFEKVGLRGQR